MPFLLLPTWCFQGGAPMNVALQGFGRGNNTVTVLQFLAICYPGSCVCHSKKKRTKKGVIPSVAIPSKSSQFYSLLAHKGTHSSRCLYCNKEVSTRACLFQYCSILVRFYYLGMRVNSISRVILCRLLCFPTMLWQ